ncbi:MAG: FecR family protein [Cyclobacteriaceae bacterium]|nr:FecR family protein [Cyclobacteriaceae bacterium]
MNVNNKEYIEKWLNGTLSNEERVLFEKTEAYATLAKLSESVKSFEAPEYNVQYEYARLQSKINSKTKVQHISFSWIKPILRVAAILTVFVGVYFYFISNPIVSISTLAAESTKFYLPDSSQVNLNAASTLEYHKKNWNDNRLVSLKGEAYFKVAKGARFDVETVDGIVSVLGTEFNVKTRDGYFEVVCYEGLVQVKNGTALIKLERGKVFRIVKGTVATELNTRETSPAWMRKESAFESVPFAEVLSEFERQYNVTITTKNVDGDQLFTGRFAHTSISLALKSISIPLDLTYVIDETKKTVVLSRETK